MGPSQVSGQAAGSAASLSSEWFRVGVREARVAMTRGALVSLVQPALLAQALACVDARQWPALAKLCSQMAGPLSLDQNPAAMAAPAHERAMIVSECLAQMIWAAMPSSAAAQAADRAQVLEHAVDALCRWIDQPWLEASSDALQAARDMAGGQPLDGAAAAAIRLGGICRLAPPLGVLLTLARVPAALWSTSPSAVAAGVVAEEAAAA